MKMRFLVLVLVGLFLNHAMAVEKSILVLETKKDYSNSPSHIAAAFNINKELGRAWVTVAFHYNTGDSTRSYSNLSSMLVPGLSYDSATKQVVFNSDGLAATCAEQKWYGLKQTKQCQFKVTEIKRQRDNGFYIVTETYYQIYLKIGN
ncbi:MAG: hypothetical protein HYV97_08115 [Bdellovibrio sp.]|nr:hypothetical protein [Bdellovibrio sp.]